MNEWFFNHPWITYFIIYVALAYVYNKVFKVQKRLPILKEILIYIILAIGSFILLLFQLDLQLPIIPSLAVAVGLMFIVRIRYWITDRQKKQE
ncbi:MULTISPECIES: YlaH-like family protein [Paenibacillus]|uniref:YlaH-like family protein n=1 Tax=Paenibacillus residui TaxID=629724 RepID=A0ABW3DCA6_9BACL|nr:MULTISPECIES: YlaH-like family protein [Paenibacillaceae]